MTFERTWTVRFADTDMFGIAFYPRIVEAIHETSEMYMQSVGWSYARMAREGLGFPLVEVDVEFERPVEADDEVRIGLDQSLGESSLRFDYEAHCDGIPVFTGFEQRVCTSEDEEGAVPIPEDIRRALESGGD